MIGDLDTADATARALANRSGAVVVSVDYRLAPEHPAPAALEDCLAALTWAVENAELLGVDASRVAVGGDSAGGNLAALPVPARARRVRARDRLPAARVPGHRLHAEPPVDRRERRGLLPHQGRRWSGSSATTSATGDPKDPSVSPLHADSLAGLPPALVITAEFDPLRDEGEAYAAALRDAGVAGRGRPLRRPDPRVLRPGGAPRRRHARPRPGRRGAASRPHAEPASGQAAERHVGGVDEVAGQVADHVGAAARRCRRRRVPSAAEAGDDGVGDGRARRRS